MKTLRTALLSLILCLPLTGRASLSKVEERRSLQRIYPLEAQGKIQISNRFGNLRIRPWERLRLLLHHLQGIG